MIESYDVLLKLSLQNALVGVINRKVFAVTGGIEENKIHLAAYFIGDVTDKDEEMMQIVGAEVISNFPEGFTIQENCFSIVRDKVEVLSFWAFMRDESDLY